MGRGKQNQKNLPKYDIDLFVKASGFTSDDFQKVKKGVNVLKVGIVKVLWSKGYTQENIAIMFGKHRTTITSMVKKKSVGDIAEIMKKFEQYETSNGQ